MCFCSKELCYAFTTFFFSYNDRGIASPSPLIGLLEHNQVLANQRAQSRVFHSFLILGSHPSSLTLSVQIVATISVSELHQLFSLFSLLLLNQLGLFVALLGIFVCLVEFREHSRCEMNCTKQ